MSGAGVREQLKAAWKALEELRVLAAEGPVTPEAVEARLAAIAAALRHVDEPGTGIVALPVLTLAELGAMARAARAQRRRRGLGVVPGGRQP
ncbi:MAG: hypothetical protein ACK4MT_05730 [Thermaurantiacus tibetensis]|uniref:hypothetical protein n=1 Tax=Thermaurantiacus tibetensis TaxID=2759035 RepID=UPI00188EBC4D|nr:hypothetical protein [Thermaurantiacus tibetensis]